MAEKTSQTNSSSNNLPSVPAVAPTSDTPYIQPIIGKLGYDTEHPDIFGIGASPDNGVSFRVFASFDGLVFNDNDIDAIWDNGTSEKVKSEVNSATAEIPAVKSAADEAVKKADSAIASSKVNSDAIVAQSEAISEAKAAMDSATAEIQQTASNAASDAAKIRADVAQVKNEVDTAKAANSASVEALKSDVSAAKQDLADVHDSLTKAQAAAEESQKAIDKSIAKINSDIEQDRKDIASAQQANDDTAKQLDTYSKQAQDQGKTIKSIQDKQDGFTATLADVQGNVTQVSDKVDGLSASLKDAQDNVASIKAQADQLSATLTDHAKSIATLTASAKELSSTLEDADGRLSKVEQTAQTNSSTLSDVQGDLSQVKQDATTLTATLKDAQGNISTLQQKADSVSAQLASAQGNIASLQTDVTGIKATLVSHEGDIHTLQADSKTLKDDMQDAQGDISTLKKTSTDVTSELKDHAGRISKAEQTAATLTNEFADQQDHLNKVEQKATGTEQTVANQQGQINSIQTDAAGIHETLTGQGNQIANINVTLNGLNSKYESVSGDLGKLKSQAQWITVTSAVDLNNIKTPCHEFLKGTVTNAPNESAWWYLTVEGSDSGRITQTVIADQSNNRYTRRWADGWSAWVKDATQTDVTELSNRITNNSTQITQNQQAIALKADQSTVNNLSGQVSQAQAQLEVQADQISSRASSTDFKTLNDKVDGMKIGGRNLVAGTAEPYTMGYGIPNTTWQNGYAYETLPTKILVGEVLPQNNQFFANLVPGQEYTQTIWFETDASVKKLDAAITWFTNAGHDEQPAKIIKVGENSYKLFSTYTWPGKTDNNVRLFDIFYLQDAFDLSTGTYIKFGKLKLEEGNVSTDWTPAPEDTITAIQKNSTAIDQTNQKISLKADQTEVDQIKNTASQNSSRLDVMAGQISSKVTATDVNNIVNSKGYATTSTVQSLVTQKAGMINESITNLTSKVNSNNGGGVNLQGETDACSFPIGNNGNTTSIETYSGSTKMIHAKNGGFYTSYDVRSFVPTPGETYTLSADVKGDGVLSGGVFRYEGGDNGNLGTIQLTKDWKRISNTVHIDKVSGQWIFYPSGSSDFYLKHLKIERGSVATPWTPAPSDNATVTQVQQITASIDGIQSTVANKADKSQITQLSNVIQSKVSTNDFTSKVSQLSKDINARVSKGDLMSQINLEAGQTLIESKKLFLDADSVVFSGKAFIPDAAIENLSLDKLTTGSLKVPLADDNGNAISLDESGITINSALSPVTWIPFYGKSDDQSGFYLSLSSKGMKFVNHFVYGKDTQKQIGAKSDDYTFMDIQPDVLHYRDGSTDNVNIPSGLTIYVPQETSSSLGPASPGGFFAMGYKNYGSALHGQDIKKGVEIAYVSKEINGWLEGFHVETNMFVHPRGADHGIRFAWVSWSAWDFGERYPAIVNDTANWGGVAFPKSGAVTLFNATGKYYTPDKDTGHGTYSDYQ